jgi:hypothetical protein
MSKKLTQSEFVAKVNAVHGSRYDLSESVYRGATSKVRVRCLTHGFFEIAPASLYLNGGCRFCTNEKLSKERVLSLDDIRLRLPAFDHITYPHIEREYKNANSMITVRCEKHGDGSVKTNSLINASKYACAKCGIDARAGAHKMDTSEFVARATSTHGDRYDYSRATYSSSTEHIEIVCKVHGSFLQTAITHLQGSGCPKCANNEKNNYRKLTEDQILERVPSNLTYVSTSDRRVALNCSEHGEFTTNKFTLSINTECPKCSLKRRTLNQVIRFDEFEKRARQTHGMVYSYDSLSYTQMKGKVSIVCQTHGVFSQLAIGHVSRGDGCPTCGTLKDSKPQIKISEFLERFCVRTERNYKLGNTRHEIDVFLPDYNIGIEYNGLFYHSQRYRKNSSVHLDKAQLAEKNGIRLIQFFSDEIESRWCAVDSFLMNLIGVKRPFRVFARKCEIDEVAQSAADEFYDTHHIQGAYRSGTNYGLFSNNVLIACMTFSKRGSARSALIGADFELARFASCENVVGGASRLFKKLIVVTGAKRVVSFSDNRLFTGSTYIHLGFTKSKVYGPNYSYVDKAARCRLHKSKFQHKDLKVMFGDNYDATKTERENCEANGYYRVYDCGLTKWVWENKTAPEGAV